MCWTDRVAIENISQLQKDFQIQWAVETGTFRGINAELYSYLFPHVATCEINYEFCQIARSRLKNIKNVTVYNEASPDFLSVFPFGSSTFVYLDAHFYDPAQKIKWVVLEELRALRNKENIILCIHDFDNGMGHLIYDGESLNWELIGEQLKEVNNNFSFYTNTATWCEVFTLNTISELPIVIDEGVLDAIHFVHSTPEREYRGMLFATPKPLDLTKYKLREFWH